MAEAFMQLAKGNTFGSMIHEADMATFLIYNDHNFYYSIR